MTEAKIREMLEAVTKPRDTNDYNEGRFHQEAMTVLRDDAPEAIEYLLSQLDDARQTIKSLASYIEDLEGPQHPEDGLFCPFCGGSLIGKGHEDNCLWVKARKALEE